MKNKKLTKSSSTSNTIPAAIAASPKAPEPATAVSDLVAAATVGVTPAIEALRSPGADPLDLASLRMPTDYAALSSVRRAITVIHVGRPPAQEFIRVRAGDDWRAQFAMLEDKEHRETYIVPPALATTLGGEARLKQLYTYMTRGGSVGFWAVNQPGADGRLDTWSQSAHRAAEIAEAQWIRLVANSALGAYDCMVATGIAHEPAWPQESFEELIRIAFRDRVISSMDHPLIRRLKGEV